MKILSLLFIGLLAFQASATESRKKAEPFRIYDQITFKKGKKTYARDMNLMDDGIEVPEDSEFVGYGAKFTLHNDESYEISAKFESNDPKAKDDCTYHTSYRKVGIPHKSLSWVTVDFFGSPETDSGDQCVYTIEISNGKKAVFSIYSEGT